MKIVFLIAHLSLLFFYSLAHAEDCSLVLQEEKIRLERCANVNIVFLSGDPLTRAKNTGKLIHDGHLRRDSLDYFSQKVLDAVRTQPSWVKVSFTWLLNQSVRLMQRNAPNEFALEVDAMASAIGENPILLRRAYSLPDISALLHALGNYKMLRILPASGCTSVAKKNGNDFIFGRNLDFAGVNTWDHLPSITVSLPEPGSPELKHAAFGSDGVLYGGITGVNEAGIAFAVHQNYTKALSLNGIPMLYIGEKVLREAHNLEEAEKILKGFRPGPLWTFLVADLNKKEMLAVESSLTHFSSRRMQGDIFAQSNHMMSEDKSLEYISTGTKFNSIYRMKIALEALEKISQKSDMPKEIARILSRQEGDSGDISAYHDILKGHTIQTVLLRSNTERTLYLSMDPAPTASGRYLSFPLEKLWSGKIQTANIFNLSETPINARKKQMEISQSFHEYFDKHDLDKALLFLQDHNSFDASLFRAVVAYEKKQWQIAKSIAQEALSNPRWLTIPAYIRQSMQWVEILSLWKSGASEEAKEKARSLLEKNPVSERIRLFTQALISGKIEKRMLHLHFEFFTGDLSGRAN